MNFRANIRAFALIAAIVSPSFAIAATVTVMNTNDTGSGSLRDAILGAADGTSINFDPSIIPQTITLTSGEIDINASISMTGGVTISGNSASRIFKIAAGKTVSLQALTFSDGLSKGANGGAGGAGGPGFGGAIWNQGTLHLLSCNFSDNHALGGGGGVGVATGGAGGNASGGAIYNDSGASLDISSCEFDQNASIGGPGGTGAAAGGVGGNAFGGAIWGEGDLLSITGSRFESNTVEGGSGGPANGHGGLAQGGAVWTADQQFSASDLTLQSNTAVGGFGVDNGNGFGGDAEGGALLVESDTAPTIDRSTFDGNSASAGATLTEIGHFGHARGGAISLVGALTIRTSTISNNTASIHSEGGGIFASGSIAVTNCTITGNSVQEGSGGGFSSTQASTLTNVTIAGNVSDGSGGGIHITGGPTLIVNSIVAQNTTSSANPDGLIENVNIVSGGHNVIGVAFGGASGGSFTPAAGDQIGTAGTPLDPALDPLANIGGPTATMGLKLTSPALDHGDDASCPATDQTTVTTRPQGAHSDVGAYELPVQTGSGGNAFTLTVQIIGSGSVTSAPAAGIDCPTSCSAAYFTGTSLTLTETPVPGSTFLGWSGGCSGVNSTAPVLMNSAVTCTATFTSPETVPTLGSGALAGLAILLGISGWIATRRE